MKKHYKVMVVFLEEDLDETTGEVVDDRILRSFEIASGEDHLTVEFAYEQEGRR